MTKPTKAEALDATVAAGNQWALAPVDACLLSECPLCVLADDRCGDCPVSDVMGAGCSAAVAARYHEDRPARRAHVLTSVALMIAVMEDGDDG